MKKKHYIWLSYKRNDIAFRIWKVKFGGWEKIVRDFYSVERYGGPMYGQQTPCVQNVNICIICILNHRASWELSSWTGQSWPCFRPHPLSSRWRSQSDRSCLPARQPYQGKDLCRLLHAPGIFTLVQGRCYQQISTQDEKIVIEISASLNFKWLNYKYSNPAGGALS